MPGHIVLKFADKVSWHRSLFGVAFSWIIFLEKAQKLFHIIFTVFIVKVDDESYWSYVKYFNFLGLTVDLQILYELVFSADLLIELEVVNDPLLCERPHLLIVMAIFIKDPLKIRYSFSRFDLLPYFPLKEDLSHEIFVVVPFYYMESQIICYLVNFQLFL